jgi:ribosomal protein S19
LKSTWKLPYIPLILFRKNCLKKKIINLRLKNAIIPFIFLDKKIKICIFNGIWYLSLMLNLSMLNCKLGEFIFTKRSDTQTHLKRKVQKKPKGHK